MKLMIVDDSVLIRERIVNMLKGIQQIEIVGEAENSTEAMAIFSKFSPEVIILDIKLPGENGIEILKKIKKKSQKTKVIIFTNFPYPQYKTKCMELGADYFFDKSVDFDSLEKALQDISQGISSPKH